MEKQDKEGLLIAAVYHILFVNNIADSYAFDAICFSGLKEDKRYRFKVKQLAERYTRETKEYDKQVARCFGKNDVFNFATMNDELYEDLSKYIEDFEKAISASYSKSGLPERYSKLVVATNLLWYAYQNMLFLIDYVSPTDKSIKHVKWVSHKKFADYFETITKSLRLPEITKDLTAISKWSRLQKYLNDFEWVADSIGKAEMINNDEQKEELSEAFEGQDIQPKACLLRR